MLEKIRKAGHHFLFKVLFLLIAIVFAIGLLDFSNPNSNVVVTIGDHKISLNEFLEEKEKMVNELGLDKDQVQAQQDFIDMNVLMQLISTNLIHQEIKELGINIAPEVVVEYIKNYSAFKKNNEFDIENYKKILELNNISEEQLLEESAERIASKFLFNTLSINLPLKNILSSYLKDYLTSKRDVSLITIDANKINIKNIKDEDIKNYYEQNKDSFYTKDYRSFDYLLINQDEIANNIKLADEDLLKEYEISKEDYLAPATRDFYHFLCPTQEVANQVISELKNGKNYELVAKEFVPQNVIGEMFIQQTDQSFLANLNPSIFQLKENDVTIPTKSDLGWHVFQIIKIHPEQYKSFAEVKEDIKNNLIYKKQESILNDLLGLVEEDVATGSSFDDIATRMHVHLHHVNKIAEDGSYEKNDQKNNAKLDHGIIELAFQMEEKEESAITLLSDEKTYVLVKINEIIPARVQSFDEVKNLVKDLYLNQLRDTVALEVAKVLKEKISAEEQDIIQVRNGKNVINNNNINSYLTSIIEKYDFNPKTLVINFEKQEIKRPELGQNNISALFVNYLFDLGLNQVSQPEQIDNAKYILAKINQLIKAPLDKIDPEIYAQIEQISDSNYINEIYDLYMNYLKGKYIIEINKKPINEYYIE